MFAARDRTVDPTDHKTVTPRSPQVPNQAGNVSQHAEARINCPAGFESVGGKSMVTPLAARKQVSTVEAELILRLVHKTRDSHQFCSIGFKSLGQRGCQCQVFNPE